MFRICLALAMIVMMRQPVLAQSATEMSEDLSQASLVQEQAAICAAFARVMEYSGLLEETRGKLWRERRFYAGAILRQSIADESGQEPSNGTIDGIINQYSGWMINLFSATPVVSGKSDIEERDKLKDYVSTLCTPLFTNADKVIARVKPELFDVAIIQQTTPQQNVDTTNLGPRIQNSPVSPVTLNVNTPETEPEIEPATPAATALDTAPELPAVSAPDVAATEDTQATDGKDTSALLSAARDDENIAILIDENMTLRAQVEVLEKDLLAASEALDNVLTARTVITTDDAGNSVETALPDEDVVIEDADDLTPVASNQQALVYRPVSSSDDMIAEPQQPAIDVTAPLPENTMQPEGYLPEGSMQVQLASYTSMERAEVGIATLQQEVPAEFDEISFMIKTATLASGKTVYRIISSPIDMVTAKTLCSHFWSMQYGCIIKMAGNTS